jgi:hypothetical protein
LRRAGCQANFEDASVAGRPVVPRGESESFV